MSNDKFDYLIKDNVINLIKNNRKFDYKDITITAIILCYNEENYIKTCIDSVVDKVDEIIIVDTGSTDNSVTIINNYNNDRIHLYKHQWNDDFSEVRNYGISKAQSDWLFFIDADEELSNEVSRELLHKFLLYLANCKYSDRICVCPKILERCNNQVYDDVPRIFMNNRNMYYYGFVHELVKNDYFEIIYIKSELVLYHDGYQKKIFNEKKKSDRNTRLIKKMLEIEPDSVRWNYFYLRDGYNEIDNEEKSILIKKILLKDSTGPMDETNIVFNGYTFNLLTLFCKVLIDQKNYEELNVVTELMNKIKPNNSNSIYFDSLVLLLKSKAEQKQLLTQIVNYRKENFNTQIDMISSEGYHIDLLIGLLLFENMEYYKAYKYFKFLSGKFNDNNTVLLVNKYIIILEKILCSKGDINYE